MIEAEQRREGLMREFVGDDDPIYEFRVPGAIAPMDWDQVELIRQETNAARNGGLADFMLRAPREPEPPTFQETFQGIFDEAFNLLVQRQVKYGPNNIAQQGMWGVLTRIADDKISRIKRAFSGTIENGAIELDPIPEGDADDTFEDACLDLINYGAILLALKRGVWGRPLA